MMTMRQKVLKTVYPLLMKLSRRTGSNAALLKNESGQLFQKPIYDLSVSLNTGETLPLHQLKGRKILFVNTASHCGYTAQYNELQQLQQRHQSLQIIAFPANDFNGQEPEGDAAIALFCQTQFGLSFPVAKKSGVLKGAQQNPIYQWLTHKEQNGWNSKAPGWNFSKYLVDEHGALTHYFDAGISPLSQEMQEAIESETFSKPHVTKQL